MTDALTALLESTVRTATPIAFAALGEAISERAGVINIGLEGAIIAGALGAVLAAGTGGVALGFAGAILSGVAVAAVFAAFTIALRVDQIITGTAMTMLALGLTGMIYRAAYGTVGAALGTPTIGPAPIPLLASIPVFGPAFFSQPLTTYVAMLLAPAAWWWMFRTHAGLALRACGEHPDAAEAAGVHVSRVQTAAVLVGGALGGLAGGTLVLAQAGTFVEGMSAGRGFIAIAIVVLGRWHPIGVLVAALLFGAANSVQFLFQAMGWQAPYQLFLAIPYVLTLVALASVRSRGVAPAALGHVRRAVN